MFIVEVTYQDRCGRLARQQATGRTEAEARAAAQQLAGSLAGYGNRVLRIDPPSRPGPWDANGPLSTRDYQGVLSTRG